MPTGNHPRVGFEHSVAVLERGKTVLQVALPLWFVTSICTFKLYKLRNVMRENQYVALIKPSYVPIVERFALLDLK
jgi:hypothetical protein